MLLLKLEQKAIALENIQVDNSSLSKDSKELTDRLQHVTKERVTLQWLNTNLNLKVKQIMEDKAAMEKKEIDAMAQLEKMAKENSALMEEYEKIVSEAEKNFFEKVEMERSHKAMELKVKARFLLKYCVLCEDMVGKITVSLLLSVCDILWLL